MSFFVDFSGIKGPPSAGQGMVHSVSHGPRNLTPASLAFQFQTLSPRDVSGGMSSGKRSHMPITIVKQVNRSSPLHFHTLANSNEVLPEVKLVFSKPGAGGTQKPHFTVTLTNAQVSGYKQYAPKLVPTQSTPKPHSTVSLTNATISGYNQYAPKLATHSSTPDTNEQEEISFTFQQISITNVLGGVSANDDWWKP
jgi:type VI protein secretion system component Hcp